MDGRRVILIEVKGDVAVLLPVEKASHAVGNVVAGQGEHVANVDLAAAAGNLLHFALGHPAVLQNPVHIFQEDAPALGQVYPPSALFKEGHLQFLFQGGNGAAERGLGNVQLFRRFSVILILCHRLKVVQLVECHNASPSGMVLPNTSIISS